MKKLLVCLVFLLLLGRTAAAQSDPKAPNNFNEGFEEGYLVFDDGVGVIHLRQSGSTAETDYAPGIKASDGKFYARLTVQPANNINGDQFNGICIPGAATGNNSFSCGGPFTEWGLPYGGFDGKFDTGIPIKGKDGARTSIDIYLDTAFAAPFRTLGGTTDYRFDWDSDLLDINGNFLQDYIFNVATGLNNGSATATYTNDTCGGNVPASGGFYVVEASTNSQRSGANAHNPTPPNPPQVCISQSGWYTFMHIFRSDKSNNLEVDMLILDSHSHVVGGWTLHPGIPFSNVGYNYLGWFPDQEINDLAIDNVQRRLE